MRLGLVALTTLAACVPAGAGDDDVEPDGGPPPPPPVALEYRGTYALAEVWDLSRPFGPDGIGGAIADALIAQAVELAGVPAPLEDEATDLVAAAVRQPIIDQVDGVVPEDVASGSPTLAALDAIFSAVDVGGTLALQPSGSTGVGGIETITAIAVHHEGATLAISMTELLADSGAVTIAGDFDGTFSAPGALAIGSHPLELRYGRLVAMVARDALGIDVDAIADAAAAALDCAAIVDRFTTADAYTIEVQGQGFTVPTSALETACAALEAELADAALGLVRYDAGVTLGGPAHLADTTGDGIADSVTSDAGYGGVITAVPGPIVPQISAWFRANR